MLYSPGPARTEDARTANFPKVLERVQNLPEKEKFWIFFLTGQSNMAGRGLVTPADTVSHPRILSIDKDNNWVYAKEPLHPYEPNLTGLDCGVSFAKTLLESVPDDVTIGLLPCAVGGSSISQWLYDEEFRGVQLFSNFREKAALGTSVGIVKGILWHQGESDAHPDRIPLYGQRLDSLFTAFRQVVGKNDLPIVMGELGTFSDSAEKNAQKAQINVVINSFANENENTFYIDLNDLTSKADLLHFDARSQRVMGERFATRFKMIYGW